MHFSVLLLVCFHVEVALISFSVLSASAANLLTILNSNLNVDRNLNSIRKRNSDTSSKFPLILTPYINEGLCAEAQEASRVDLESILQSQEKNQTNFKNEMKSVVESYSGFFTVNATHNSNLFFWFFPAAESPAESPVVLFLSGGPGSPSTTEAFSNGPLELDENFNVKLRKQFSWTEKHSMLYIDSPVGAGFSFTQDPKGYSRNDNQIAEDLYEALEQFFQIFSHYRSQPFFIAGNSYGGKVSPVLGNKIHDQNKCLPLAAQINLKGLILMSPVIDPINQLQIATTHHTFGLYDQSTRDELLLLEKLAVEKVTEKDYYGALALTDAMYGTVFNKSSLFNLKTGYESLFEGVLSTRIPSKRTAPRKVISSPQFRRALHVGVEVEVGESDAVVGVAFGVNSPQLLFPLVTSIFDSAKSSLECFLSEKENYRVLILGGQLDIAVPVVLLETFVHTLNNWTHLEAFLKAERRLMLIGGREMSTLSKKRSHRNDYSAQIAGYYKEFGNLVLGVVREAGHHVWIDQLKFSSKFFTMFTHAQA